MEIIVLRGSKEICAAVGVNWKRIREYVDHKGLPAWQIDGKGPWLALPEDLAKWIHRQRDEHLKNPTD
jgi:hypothetical protein